MKDAERCPCGRVTAPAECARCKHFRCAVCKVWRAWQDGNEDGQECNMCWAERTDGGRLDPHYTKAPAREEED